MSRIFACLVGIWLTAAAQAADFVVLQSTTSTQNSGLLEAILPVFTQETGIEVRVVAVGTGQALRNAQNGDGDVLLVHAREQEDKFVADGWGVKRFDLMYNDFVIVGPAADSAKISGYGDAVAALEKIATDQALFASRGDDSGTHIAEMKLWQLAGWDVAEYSGTWYRETGAGMGATLNIAVEIGAYAMTDRATWISFGNKRDHKVLAEGDPKLFNQYGLIAVNPARHASVRAPEAALLIDWLLGPIGQAEIANYKIQGEQLFFPNAATEQR